MKIVDSVKGLIDVFPKSDVEQKVEELRAQSAGKDKEIFAKFDKALGKSRLASPLAHRAQKTFDEVNRSWRGNYVSVINEAVKLIPTQAEQIGKILAGYRNSNIVRDTIDYPTAAMIQYTTSLDWFLTAARSLAIATYDAEISIIADTRVNETYVASQLNGQVIRDIALICRMILKYDKKFDKVIYDLPDLVVNEESARGVKAGMFKSNLLGSDILDNLLSIFNPLRWTYAVGKLFSELKIKRLQSMKKEVEVLELKDQYYKQLKAEGRKDARLETIIENLEEEINSLNYDIKELEEEIQSKGR